MLYLNKPFIEQMRADLVLTYITKSAAFKYIVLEDLAKIAEYNIVYILFEDGSTYNIENQAIIA